MAKRGGTEETSVQNMSIQFPCSGCRRPILASFAHIGRRGRCPHCDAPVIVPFVRLPSAAAAELVPAPPGAPVSEEASVVTATKADRRHFVRFAVEDSALRLARSGGHLTHHSYPLKDMSRGGVAFLVGITPGLGPGIEVGELLRISVDVQAFADPMEMSCCVTRVTPEGADTFVVGAAFTEISSANLDRIGSLEESERLRSKARRPRS